MLKLKTSLKNRIKDSKKVAILGVGSELRGDDAAGMAVSRQILQYIKEMKIDSAKVFLGETAPENLTGEIKRFKPNHLIIIDAVDFQKKAGAVGIIDDSGEGGASFSTHRMPMGILKDYFYKSIACKTTIIGIQPKCVNFGTGLSREIQLSAKAVSRDLLEVLNSMHLKKEKAHV